MELVLLVVEITAAAGGGAEAMFGEGGRKKGVEQIWSLFTF